MTIISNFGGSNNIFVDCIGAKPTDFVAQANPSYSSQSKIIHFEKNLFQHIYV
jgi:hypothetical protein